MKNPRSLACCLGLLSTLALPACSRDEHVAPGLYSLTGHLLLIGYHVDADGRFAGTRIVSDADGIEVELTYGNQVVGRATTLDGTYRFFGIGPGAYVARTRLIGGIADQSAVLTITTSDLVTGDTLRLASQGDLYPVPNPVLESTWVSFGVPDTQEVDVRILDLAGRTVKILLAMEVLPARHRVLWDGRNQAGIVTSPGSYWVTFVSGEDVRAQLLFR